MSGKIFRNFRCFDDRGVAAGRGSARHTKNTRVGTDGVFSRLVFDIDQNVLHTAVQEGAEVVQRDGADGLVVLEAVEQTAAYAEIVDELIGRDALFFHGSI